MSVRSQYDSASDRIIVGNVGAKFGNSTLLNTTVAIGTSSVDVVAITVQSGLYFQEAQIEFLFPNTSTIADMSMYASRGLAQADIYAMDTHIITTETSNGALNVTYRITSIVDVDVSQEVAVGFTATVGVVDLTIQSSTINLTKIGF
tara:strand:- start:158 stop:598 length:441 start_codon:yes stop_codon:yes gene_type:complete